MHVCPRAGGMGTHALRDKRMNAEIPITECALYSMYAICDMYISMYLSVLGELINYATFASLAKLQWSLLLFRARGILGCGPLPSVASCCLGPERVPLIRSAAARAASKLGGVRAHTCSAVYGYSSSGLTITEGAWISTKCKLLSPFLTRVIRWHAKFSSSQAIS